jgi:galactose oxidase
MSLNTLLRRTVLAALPILVPALWAGSAKAEVNEVVVGITPNCPYGLGACWAGAYEALSRLEGVASVTTVPDNYNCTATVRLKHKGLPDPGRWVSQFKSIVGESYGFRGIELTVVGSIVRKDNHLVLQAPGVVQPITLAPLRHKLQWNFRKAAARQPEPDEQAGYDQLDAKFKEAKTGTLRVQISGPFQKTANGVSLEVREFFLLVPGADPKGRY